MPKKKSKVCAYCGKMTTAWTKDHAVPDCMWLGPLPNFVLTVPSCIPCQQRWSADEGYFRSVVAAIADQSAHPDVKAIVERKVVSHVQKHPDVWNDLVGTMAVIPHIDPATN
jgi:hypothetical protein